MTPIRGSARKGARSYLSAKGAKKAGKAARKTVKRWPVTKAVQRVAPTRLVLALGGVATAALAATVAKRRTHSGAAQGTGPASTAAAATDPDHSAGRYVETQTTGS